MRLAGNVTRVMQMMELVIVACLATDLTRCTNVSLEYAAEGLTSRQCVMSAMPQIAKWSGDHPNLVPMRWTCRPTGLRANI